MENILIITLTLCLESRSQGELGMRHVLSAMVNSTDGTIESIAKDCLKPRRYSCWNNSKPTTKIILYWSEHSQLDYKAYLLALRMVQEVANGTFKPVTDATNYVTRKLYQSLDRPAWTNGCEVVTIHKDHVFLREV